MSVRRFEVVSEFEELPKEERPILPKRQTKHSAGYDFYALEDVFVMPGVGGLIRTGVKVQMPSDEHLEIHIRSSYGMKYGMCLANGVGKHYLTDNDDADGERVGGVGSTK